MNTLIDELTPSAPDVQLRDACEQLVHCFSPSALDRINISLLTAGHYPWHTGDAISTCLFAWYACNSRGFGGTCRSWCQLQASANRQRGTFDNKSPTQQPVHSVKYSWSPRIWPSWRASASLGMFRVLCHSNLSPNVISKWYPRHYELHLEETPFRMSSRGIEVYSTPLPRVRSYVTNVHLVSTSSSFPLQSNWHLFLAVEVWKF